MKADDADSPKTSANLRQAVDSFSRFIGGSEIEFDNFDSSLLGEWVARLLYEGYTAKTVAYYVKKLASLYNKAVNEGLAMATDAFSALQSRLNFAADIRFDGTIDIGTFEKIKSLVRADLSASPVRQLAKDIMLFAIYNGGMSFSEIASYKKDDYEGNSVALVEIVERYSKPRNKYLFPLQQSQLTPKQSANLLRMMLGDVLHDVGLKLSANADNTAFDLWSMIAMRCGISASEIAGCKVGNNTTNAICAFAVPAHVAPERIAAIRQQIVETLTYNPVRWYAMQFRPRVTIEMINSRLKAENISLTDIYYPMEEIMRKTGKKRIFESKPVISGLMFFRYRVTELPKLYSRIGDLAWGYRYTRDVRSQYAAISRIEIDNYQRAIGTFSPDTELYPAGTVTLNKGDRVVIIGGMFDGQPATFAGESMQKNTEKTGRIVYRLLLPGDNKCEWVVECDPRLVRKISRERFDTLVDTFGSEVE